MKILQINVFNYRKGGSEVVYFSTMELLRKMCIRDSINISFSVFYNYYQIN